MREDVVGEAAKSVVADGGHAKQGELNQAPLCGLGVPLHVRHTLRHFARCLNTVRSQPARRVRIVISETFSLPPRNFYNLPDASL